MRIRKNDFVIFKKQIWQVSNYGYHPGTIEITKEKDAGTVFVVIAMNKVKLLSKTNFLVRIYG